MKNNMLYVMVGVPGSGKSYFIENNNLTPFTIGRDNLRELFLSPVLNNNGFMGLNNNNEALINDLFNKLLHSRLSSGSPLIIDATNLKQDQFKKYQKLADQYAYKVQYIDFGLNDYNFYLKRNEQREEYKRLDERVIKYMYNLRENLDFKNVDVVKPEVFLKEIKQTPLEQIRDISNYNNLIVVGDLQGCYSVLEKYLTNDQISDENFYVFLGDYIDRGIENAKVLNFVKNHIDKNNFLFLKGNHEENLLNYALNNQEKLGKMFINETLPDLEKNGYNKENILELYNKLDEVVYLKYNNENIICSHGGLSTVPKYPKLLGKNDNNNGTGMFSQNVDQLFSINEKNWVQIHGHRNHHNLPIIAYDNSYNLEGGVEYGDDLRVLKFKKGFKLIPEAIYVKNEIYQKGVLKMNEIELEFEQHMEGLNEKKAEYKSNLDLLKQFRNNPLIKETQSETMPHISSFNFTKEAFFNSKSAFLEELVSHARGMFVNNKTGEIISRGFEKFFNVGELDISSLDSVEKNFTPPFILYKKENGFFGTVGYDQESDQLIITSKSRIEGDFPNYFKAIFEQQFSKEEQQKLKRYAQKYNINYIFEINDPINDPHIIKYEKPHLVLLDIVKRQFKFQHTTYNSLVNFSKMFNDLKVKKSFAVFKDYKGFESFYNNVMEGKKNVDFEGFVVEDVNSNKVKIKAPYYAAWKFMRGMKDFYTRELRKFNENESKGSTNRYKYKDLEGLKNTILLSSTDKLKNRHFPENLEKEMVEFLNWIIKSDFQVDFLKKDIISLRDEFHLQKENKLKLSSDNPTDEIQQIEVKKKRKLKM